MCRLVSVVHHHLLLHDEEEVEAVQEILAFFGRLVPGCLVPTDCPEQRNDVHWFEKPGHIGEQLKPIGMNVPCRLGAFDASATSR